MRRRTHRGLAALLLAACTAADYERDGQPGYGSTSTSGRSPTAWPVNYDLAKVGEILPGIQ